MTADPFPLPGGGYCVRRVDDDRCVDLFNETGKWVLALTARPNDVHPHDHATCDRLAAWYYAITYTDRPGESLFNDTPGSWHATYQKALAAARTWDGTGEPPDHQGPA